MAFEEFHELVCDKQCKIFLLFEHNHKGSYTNAFPSIYFEPVVRKCLQLEDLADAIIHNAFDLFIKVLFIYY